MSLISQIEAATGELWTSSVKRWWLGSCSRRWDLLWSMVSIFEDL